METIGAGANDWFETMVFPCSGEDEHGDPISDYRDVVECKRHAESVDAERYHRATCLKYAEAQ
jgi:hypothetical protein